MHEYKLSFNWSRHWTALSMTEDLDDLRKYIQDNLPEMEEAMEEDEDNSFSIDKYDDGIVCDSWRGSPQDLLDIIDEI